MNTEAAVRELLDREAIRDLARRYAHCVWQKDAAGAIALFAEDGEMDTGDGAVLRGHAALLETYTSMFASSELHPMVHNHVIDLQGSRASGTCYLDLQARVDGKDKVGAGCYHDEYVRVGDAWKFQSRKLSMCYFVESATDFTS